MWIVPLWLARKKRSSLNSRAGNRYHACMTNSNRLGAFLIFVAITLTASAQQPAGGARQITQLPAGTAGANQAGEPPAEVSPNYTLGANDQILIRAPEAEEINERPFRIDTDGFLTLPLIGRIRAAGLSIHQLEADVTNRLREYFVKPEVFISVTQFRAAPVFFEGMFLRPGIYTLQGRRTLVEMLALVGGLQPGASRRIKIRRHLEYGPIPLPSAIEDPERKISTAEISMASLRENVNPAEDIVLEAYDVVTVERAELIYVGGEVTRPGTVELGEREFVTVTQALTMVGGFTRDAKRSDARVLRPVLNTTRRAEIPINLAGIYDGKVNDFPLLPNDLLYIPRSGARSVIITDVPLLLGILNPFIYLAIYR